MADVQRRLYYPGARAVLTIVLDDLADGSRGEEIVIPIVPKGVTIHHNGYHQADSWGLVFDANYFPIDPQVVRAGHAEIYLFQTRSMLRGKAAFDKQFAGADDPAAQTGRDPEDAQAVADPKKAGKQRFTVIDEPSIIGQFDDMDIEMSSSGKWISVKGQDYTAFLMGKQWKPTDKGIARRIPTGQRLDEWLRARIAEVDTDGRLEVAVENVELSALPIVGKGETKTNGRGIPIQQDTTYWDVIYKVVERYGFIVFVRGLKVVISRPKNIDDTRSHDIKLMAWGKNVEHVQLTRHLGKTKVPRIVVRSYDPKAREPFVVEWPDGALKHHAKEIDAKEHKKSSVIQKILSKQPATKKKKAATQHLDDEFMFILAPPGMSDRGVLKAYAQNLYELIGRGERRIIATTHDLTDLNGKAILDLSAGDAVFIEWHDFDRAKVLSKDISPQEKAAYLVSRGFGQTIANEIARYSDKLVGIQRPMRIREVTYEYDVESGISVEMDMVDFVTVDGVRKESVPAKTGKAR